MSLLYMLDVIHLIVTILSDCPSFEWECYMSADLVSSVKVNLFDMFPCCCCSAMACTQCYLGVRLRLRLFYLSHTQLYREYITSSEMYSLYLTHPKWTHPEQWAAMLQRPGSSWGFGALLKDTSVVVLEEDTPPTNNPCRTWDSNPQPSAYKSDSLSIRPRLPQLFLWVWQKDGGWCSGWWLMAVTE